MIQRGPIWGQLETNMVLQIIEQLLFLLGFFNILKEILESLWERLGKAFGTASGTFGELLGRQGRLWGFLGRLKYPSNP